MSFSQMGVTIIILKIKTKVHNIIEQEKMELIPLSEFQTLRNNMATVRKQFLIAGDDISIVSEYHMQSNYTACSTQCFAVLLQDHKVEMNIISTHYNLSVALASAWTVANFECQSQQEQSLFMFGL